MQKIGNDLTMAGIQVIILLAFATALANFLLRLHRALRNTRATLSLEAQVLLVDTVTEIRYHIWSGTIPEPSTSYIGKGAALVARTAAFVCI